MKNSYIDLETLIKRQNNVIHTDMKIQNQIELDVDEAVFLLRNLADNLEQENKFNFELKGQSASVEVGPDLIAQLASSPNQFSLTFTWREEIQEQELSLGTPIKDSMSDWIPKPQTQDTIPTPQAIKAETKTEPKTVPKPQKKIPIQPISTEGFDAASIPATSALPTRMTLGATTLPFEGGFWTSAFTVDNKIYWTEIMIDKELENTKWASEDQISSLSALSPQPTKVRKSNVGEDSDDLFADLDSQPDKHSLGKVPSTKSFARPAAHMSDSTGQNSNLSDEEVASEVANWKEPTVENNVSGDKWVKPSEILKKKKERPIKMHGEEPKIISNKVTSIPAPISTQEKASANDDRQGAEDGTSSSRDQWVKPSNKASKSNEAEERKKEQIERPPPMAPDKKRKQRKKKGWAMW